MGRPPVVALLTDFGLRDHYVGVMKGVVLGICPSATIVDITHGVPPQDVLTGALELLAAYPFFPAETVFVAVVDPGVGSTRLAIAARADGRCFVGPDNGVLSLVFQQRAPERIVHLTDPRFALSTVSRTFEGRDRFAPAAAWLASGTPLASLGPPVDTWVRVRLPEPRVSPGLVEGEVVRVDRFGNLVTNIGLAQIGGLLTGAVRVEIAGASVTRLVGTYAEADEGALCAFVGSTGLLEVAVRGGSAAARLDTGRGTPVRLVEGA